MSRQQRQTQPDPEGHHHHLLSLLGLCWARAPPARLLWAHRLCLLRPRPLLGLGVGVQMQLLQADSGWTQLITILGSTGPVGGRGTQAEGSFDGLVPGPSHFPGSVSSSGRWGRSDQWSAKDPRDPGPGVKGVQGPESQPLSLGPLGNSPDCHSPTEGHPMLRLPPGSDSGQTPASCPASPRPPCSLGWPVPCSRSCPARSVARGPWGEGCCTE